jgi:RNA ligase (TIGR02306 family)
MGSTHVVPVLRLESVKSHPNADNLDLVQCLGYQVVTRRGAFAPGDLVVYFPPDSVFGADAPLGEDERRYLDKGRVRVVRLRGEPSHGMLLAAPAGAQEGEDLAERYHVTKYEPPVWEARSLQAHYDLAIEPKFPRYTDIQNGRIHYKRFLPDEQVVVTEKIHGRNARVGWISGRLVVGSHTQRKVPPAEGVEWARNIDWAPAALVEVQTLVRSFGDEHDVIVFGETYGRSVQSLDYGIPKGAPFGFRAFDLMVDGDYLSYPDFHAACWAAEVLMAPVLYRGPFDLERVLRLADGPSVMPKANHIREGVVVRPDHERTDPKLGRMILKFIGSEYMLSKHKAREAGDV